MPEKRKVANLLALAVLATVVQRPMHRYEMASVMRARGKDRDMDIKWGSLYTVVANLEKNGLLEAIEVTRQGARPERTVYQITDAGRDELVAWTRELIAEPAAEHTRFIAGLSVLATLSPKDVAGLLRRRLRAADRIGRRIAGRTRSSRRRTPAVPHRGRVPDRNDAGRGEWTQSFLDELSAGTFPHLAVWQRWHESGDVPAEFTELGERGADQ